VGRRGPKPMPKELLRARGTRRGKDRGDEPRPNLQRPSCPKWLDANAKREWRKLLPDLEPMRFLSKVDRNALARYCQLLSRWRRAEEFLQKYGDTYPIKGDDEKVRCFMPFPQVAIASKLAHLLGQLEQEFGMTPSGRSRIRVSHVPPPRRDDDEEPFDLNAFIKMGGIHRRSPEEIKRMNREQLKVNRRLRLTDPEEEQVLLIANIEPDTA